MKLTLPQSLSSTTGTQRAGGVEKRRLEKEGMAGGQYQKAPIQDLPLRTPAISCCLSRWQSKKEEQEEAGVTPLQAWFSLAFDILKRAQCLHSIPRLSEDSVAILTPHPKHEIHYSALPGSSDLGPSLYPWVWPSLCNSNPWMPGSCPHPLPWYYGFPDSVSDSHSQFFTHGLLTPQDKGTRSTLILSAVQVMSPTPTQSFLLYTPATMTLLPVPLGQWT
jgi:hypothetical protein